MKRSISEITKLIEEQEKSGQSIPVFCASRGLRDTTFYTWRARIHLSESRFTKISGERRIELELISGAVIKVSAEDLKSVLAAL